MEPVKTAAKIPLPAPGALQALNGLCARFILASLVYLGIGILLGLLLAVNVAPVTIFAHVHLTLVGFVVFLIYGVGYKLIPTMFAARHAIHSQALANLHFWLANLGLILMAGADLAAPLLGGAGGALLIAGGAIQVAGAFLFIYQMAVMLR